ncbi:hypothetical protein ACFLXC_03355 [Chloroflexota bacterium]
MHALELEEEECVEEIVKPNFIRRLRKMKQKNKPVIDRFLGAGKRANEAVVVARYNGEMLT